MHSNDGAAIEHASYESLITTKVSTECTFCIFDVLWLVKLMIVLVPLIGLNCLVELLHALIHQNIVVNKTFCQQVSSLA